MKILHPERLVELAFFVFDIVEVVLERGFIEEALNQLQRALGILR